MSSLVKKSFGNAFSELGSLSAQYLDHLELIGIAFIQVILNYLKVLIHIGNDCMPSFMF